MYILGNEAHGVDYESTNDRYAVRNYATGQWLSRKSIFDGGGFEFETTAHLASTFDENTAHKLAHKYVRGEYRLIHELDLGGYV